MALCAVSLAACAKSSQEPVSASKNFAALVASTSDEQAALLEDGELTFAEYETAFFSLVSCLESRGVQVVGTELVSPERGYAYSTLDPSSPAGQREFDETHSDCRSQYFSEIDRTWADVNADEGADEDFYLELADCLRASGVDVGGTTSAEFDAAYQQDTAAYDRCFDEVAAAARNH